MKVLFQSLYTLFSTSNTFNTAVGGQFYPGIADQERASFPFAVYNLITDYADWTFSEDIEIVTLRINVYDDSHSSSTIVTIEEYLRSLFDDAILSVTGYEFVRMHRQLSQLFVDDEMNTWHLVTDYEIELQRERT